LSSRQLENQLYRAYEVLTINLTTMHVMFIGQVLDTADVAQQVREILSVNNIGQRLFARHVLGLSQGTVSELLSKPKHWDKLTEKGRESYRRMHQWVRDGGNIAVLKAYAPKKG
jgi:homeobox protein cut-like